MRRQRPPFVDVKQRLHRCIFRLFVRFAYWITFEIVDRRYCLPIFRLLPMLNA
jgi:hypothetical protein